jgi:hypothetical protein
MQALASGSVRYKPGTSEQLAYGMTAAEVAAAVGLSRNQTATRLGECREVGFVEWARGEDGRVEERETNASGDTGRVQRLTRLGRDALAGIQRAGGSA